MRIVKNTLENGLIKYSIECKGDRFWHPLELSFKLGKHATLYLPLYFNSIEEARDFWAGSPVKNREVVWSNEEND